MRSILLLALLTAPVAAEPDWASGLVTAEGVGVADRHAPNPAVARGTSRRHAEAAARAELATAIATVKVARGGTVADLENDAAIKARIDRAVAQAIAVSAQPETDGAWRVTMAVPIEALRQAIEGGPRPLDQGGDGDPAVVVVDGVHAAPAIGWAIGGRHAAAIWVTAAPAWAAAAPHVRAGAAKNGELQTLQASGAAGTGATLYVLVTAP